MKDFDARQCNRRRRFAAVIDSVEAAPLRLFKAGCEGISCPVGYQGKLISSVGVLPEGEDEALSAINESLARKAGKALGKDDVYVHYIEAANSNFIGDRFLFLHESTLRNIADKAGSGFAFMNSHRTGGLSSPSELPFGRTFAGKYEEFDDNGGTFKRAVVGLYMLRGVHPNGTYGPSTDDLHRSIEAGTLSDVSMGLVGGKRLCDVCTQDMSARDDDGHFLCPHVPGTSRKMSDEDKAKQSARGVSDGFASYSLHDSTPQEVSAVYKGAVPGAGFRKALTFAEDTSFALQYGLELEHAYGPLFTDRERSRLRGHKKMDILRAFRFWQAAGEPAELDFSQLASVAASPSPVETANHGSRVEVSEKVSSVDETKLSEREALAAERLRQADLRDFQFNAGEYTSGLVKDSKLSPDGAKSLALALVIAQFDDQERPAVDPVSKQPVSRFELLKAANKDRASSGILDDVDSIGPEPVSLRKGESVLSNGATEADDPTLKQEERDMYLLSTTERGRESLRATDKGREYLKSRDIE